MHGTARSAGTVSGFLGKEPLLVVVPSRDNLADTNRYIKLMAYDTLQDAQRRGVPLEFSIYCNVVRGPNRDRHLADEILLTASPYRLRKRAYAG